MRKNTGMRGEILLLLRWQTRKLEDSKQSLPLSLLDFSLLFFRWNEGFLLSQHHLTESSVSISREKERKQRRLLPIVSFSSWWNEGVAAEPRWSCFSYRHRIVGWFLFSHRKDRKADGNRSLQAEINLPGETALVLAFSPGDWTQHPGGIHDPHHPPWSTGTSREMNDEHLYRSWDA